MCGILGIIIAVGRPLPVSLVFHSCGDTGSNAMKNSVYIEVSKPGDLAKTMSDIRSWLDDHDIESVGFSYERKDNGSLVIELCFANAQDAGLFSDTHPTC